MREILQCPKCKQDFYDKFNLVSLGALNMCLGCANKNNINEDIFRQS